MDKAIQDVRHKVKMEEAERLFQVHTFEIFQREINDSESAIFMSMNGLKRALQVSCIRGVFTVNLIKAIF